MLLPNRMIPSNMLSDEKLCASFSVPQAPVLQYANDPKTPTALFGGYAPVAIAFAAYSGSEYIDSIIHWVLQGSSLEADAVSLDKTASPEISGSEISSRTKSGKRSKLNLSLDVG
jgi:hypothetical protein